MKIGISIKVDVLKIDKSRIFIGKKGKYIDLTTFIDLDEQDQFGQNGFISQSVTKEEKGQGVQTQILGNCKIFYTDKGRADQQNQQPAQQQNPDPIPDDIPF